MNSVILGCCASVSYLRCEAPPAGRKKRRCLTGGLTPKQAAKSCQDRAVLTAIEGHLIASGVQGLSAAGGAPWRGPRVGIGARPCLHLFLQNQPANPTLELGGGGGA